MRGLRGYVGVDLVLTDADAVVIEVNPRLTTAYLGVRAALDENIAALALEACAGRLPDRGGPSGGRCGSEHDGSNPRLGRRRRQHQGGTDRRRALGAACV